MTTRMIISKQRLVTAFLVTSFFLFCLAGFSQRLQLTASSGQANYRGDLSAGYTPPLHGAYSLGATYDITDRYRLRINFTKLSVQGNDGPSPKAGVKERGLNFKSDIQEVALLGEYDLRDNAFHSLIPYIFGGLSIFHFDPHPLVSVDSIGDVSLHDLGTEGQNLKSGKYANRKYSLTQLNIQVGGGIRYEISRTISIAGEINYRKLFTDYLDDVSSKSYIPDSEWDLNDPIQRAAKAYSWRYASNIKKNVGFPRGNPNQNDAYYSFQLRLNIRLGAGSDNNGDLYSPRNPHGRGQLRCPKKVF